MLCSICNRISATGRDHTDCIEKVRIELEDEDLKKKVVENFNDAELGKELRALLGHMRKNDAD